MMMMMMIMYDIGLFDVDHTKPSTTTTTHVAERSAPSRSAERDKLPPANTTSPHSAGITRTTAADAKGATPTTSDTSSRLKSGLGAKGCRLFNKLQRCSRLMESMLERF